MSNRAFDNYLAAETHRDEYACCDCGYMRGTGHHPGIRCPKTGRCGQCGNDWPCADHIHLVPEKIPRGKPLDQDQAVEIELTVVITYAGKIDKSRKPKLADIASQVKLILERRLPLPKIKFSVGKTAGMFTMEDKLTVQVLPLNKRLVTRQEKELP